MAGRIVDFERSRIELLNGRITRDLAARGLERHRALPAMRIRGINLTQGGGRRRQLRQTALVWRAFPEPR